MQAALLPVRTTLAIVLFAFVHALVFPAFAEPTKSAKKEAFRLYQDSEKRYREGKFEEAAAMLRKAYALDPAPTLLFNLARALESAGDLEGAQDSYRQYLAADPNAKDRGAIEKRLATLETQLREREELRRIKERGGEDESAPLEKETTAILIPPKTEEPKSRLGPLPFVVMGTGAAGVIFGGVLGAMAAGKQSSAEAEPDFARAQSLDDSAHSLATGANIAYLAGGAVLTAGIVSLVLTVTE
jgi:tetratricopeptide (TPR) repeat protein